KCTATRRLRLAPQAADAAIEALAEALGGVAVGDPREQGTRMGPLTNLEQLRSVVQGIERLAGVTRVVAGGPSRLREPGAFVAPTLLAAHDARARELHDEEVFGPVTTALRYDGSVAEAAELVARGGGSLVTSV